MSKSCSCSFLYGPETETADLVCLEMAMNSHSEIKTELKLFRKNGLEAY